LIRAAGEGVGEVAAVIAKPNGEPPELDRRIRLGRVPVLLGLLAIGGERGREIEPLERGAYQGASSIAAKQANGTAEPRLQPIAQTRRQRASQAGSSARSPGMG
jgi:hypothetical protein